VLYVPRQSLVYPAGRAPGFDQTHVAASGICLGHGFSALALGNGGLVNLLSGAPGVLNGTLSAVMTGVGPAVASAGSGYLTFPGQSTAADPSFTTAMIFVPNAVSGSKFLFSFSSGGGNNTNGLFLSGAQLCGYRHSTAALSGINLTSGVPYFIAASANSSTVCFVVVNLLTGVTEMAIASLGGTPAAGNGTYVVGATSSLAQEASADYCAVMYAPACMAPAQLLQWAQSPWDFWYPRRASFEASLPLAGILSNFLAGYGLTSAFGLAAGIGKGALAGRGAAVARGRGLAAGAAQFAGRGFAAANARSMAAAVGAVAGRALAAAFGQAAATGKGTLAARGAAVARGRGLAAGAAQFAARGFAAANARSIAAAVGAVAGRALAAAFGQAAATGKGALAARGAAVARGRGLAAGVGAVAARTAILIAGRVSGAGRGALSGWGFVAISGRAAITGRAAGAGYALAAIVGRAVGALALFGRASIAIFGRGRSRARIASRKKIVGRAARGQIRGID
jgi:hypothetical protein